MGVFANENPIILDFYVEKLKIFEIFELWGFSKWNWLLQMKKPHNPISFGKNPIICQKMAIFWAKKVQFLPFFEGENFWGSRALKMVLRPGIKRSRRDLSKYMVKTTFRGREPQKFWPNFFRQILNVIPPYLRFWPKSCPFFWRVPGLQKWFWARESRDLKKFSSKHASEFLSDPGNPKNF